MTDSKSVGGDIVWVRVPPPAPKRASPLGLALFGIDAGLEEGDLAAGKVKKCPVDTFLARGRVPWVCGHRQKLFLYSASPLGLALLSLRLIVDALGR